MAIMSPLPSVLPSLTLDSATYTGDTASGEPTQTTSTGAQQPSINFTNPASNQITAQAIATALQNNQSNQQAAQSSPIGISPKDTGTIAGKLLNNSFSSQVNALDQFGANTLGTGLGANSLPVESAVNAAGDSVVAGSADAAGTVSGVDASGGAIFSGAGGASAGSLTATSLSSILGSAGIGALGGGLLAKLTGGNVTNGTIGGAIGGAVGGAELGAAIGSFIPIPGIGTIAGTLIGGAIGSMFGPGPPTNAEGGGGMMSPTGAVNYNLTGQKNSGPITGFSSTATNSFSNVAQAASKALGINFNPGIDFSAAISTKHPGPGGDAALEISSPSTTGGSAYDSGKIFYNPNNPASTQKAQLQTLIDAAKQSGYTDTTTLTNWYNNNIGSINQQASNTASGVFTPPAPPNIPVSGTTFASFMANKQGTSNASNAAPTV